LPLADHNLIAWLTLGLSFATVWAVRKVFPHLNDIWS
jgi:hypothetical protein